LFFTLIPVLALLSNYDQENCLINVGTEGSRPMTHDEVCDLFGAARRLTREDLSQLRASIPAIARGAKSNLHSNIRELRMDIELLEVLTEVREAIEHMNVSSTALVKTTNRLTAVMLLFTVVGVVAALVALLR
jgi:hypothetical protein